MRGHKPPTLTSFLNLLKKAVAAFPVFAGAASPTQGTGIQVHSSPLDSGYGNLRFAFYFRLTPDALWLSLLSSIV